MSNKLYPYNYSRQFERFIGQFARVFSGFQVNSGRKDTSGDMILEKVPVAIGSMDRVVASIMSDRDEFSNYKLPMISINMTGVDIDNANKRTKKETVADISPFTPASGAVSVQRIPGPPFRLSFDVAVMASSVTQLYEIAEQLMVIFNPRITVNFNSEILNESMRSEISLVSTSPQTTIPLGTSTQTPVMEFGFEMGVRLVLPRIEDDNYIRQIITKTLVVDEDSASDVIDTVTYDESAVTGTIGTAEGDMPSD